MEKIPLMSALLNELSKCEIAYQGGHSPEELAVLMELFAEAMPNENPQSIRRAFAMHRKLSTRFPTPAHIIALLPDCRVMPDRCAIPEKTSVPATDGLGLVVLFALRGDADARNIMAGKDKLAPEALKKLVGRFCHAHTGQRQDA